MLIKNKTRASRRERYERDGRWQVGLVGVHGDDGEGGEELEAGGLVAGGQVFAVPASEKARLKLHHLAVGIMIVGIM